MKQEHRDFLEANIINFNSVKLGYTKNIAIETLQMYEHIYHLYLNPSYVLTYWCGDCVFDMLKRLIYYYEGLPASEPIVEEIIEASVQVTKAAKPKAKKK